MNDNNFDEKVAKLVNLSKEDLVKKLLTTPKFGFNSEGLAQLMRDFFKDQGILPLTISEYHSKRKIKAKIKDRILHSQQNKMQSKSQSDVQCEAFLELASTTPELKAPEESYIFGKWNEFNLSQVKNALGVWLTATGKDQMIIGWADSQSDKMVGLALRKCGVGKWRKKTGFNYLLIVPGYLREIFYSHRDIKKL
jgi:hypothetical protein